jgi:hypothetical protein
VGLGDSVQEVSRGDVAHDAAPLAPTLQEVVVQNTQDLLGLNVDAVPVDDPKAVPVPVHRQAEVKRTVPDEPNELLQILPGRFRTIAAKVGVLEAVKGLDLDGCLLGQVALQVLPRRTVQGVDDDPKPPLETLRRDHAGQLLQIIRPGVDGRHPLFIIRQGDDRVVGVGLDVGLPLMGHLVSHQAAPFVDDLDPAILGEVVTAREVQTQGGTPPYDGPTDGRMGGVPLTEPDGNPVPGKHPGALLGKALGQESGVIADDDARALVSGLEPVG